MRPHLVLGLITLVGVIGAACSAPTPTPSPTVTPTPSPTITPVPTPTADVAGSEQLMAALLTGTMTESMAAAKQMGDSGDVSYIPVLMEIQFFSWRLTHEIEVAIGSSLNKLRGLIEEDPSTELRDWFWWIEWLGKHQEVRPPAGYAAWKGRLLSRQIDPAMAVFIYDGVKSRIRLEEIVWGGVSRDGIPPLTNPRAVPATSDEAKYLYDADRVFGVSINGEHRAYPLRILNAHEMANDVLGGVPIALAY